MDLIDMSNNERYDMMRKRHAFLNNLVSSYTSIDEFVRDKEHWFAMLGTDLCLCNEYAYILFRGCFITIVNLQEVYSRALPFLQ